jgi:hypothetical protein
MAGDYTRHADYNAECLSLLLARPRRCAVRVLSARGSAGLGFGFVFPVTQWRTGCRPRIPEAACVDDGE